MEHAGAAPGDAPAAAAAAFDPVADVRAMPEAELRACFAALKLQEGLSEQEMRETLATLLTVQAARAAEHSACLSSVAQARLGGLEKAPKACLHCRATEQLKRCGGCRVAWFCDQADRACLKAAWKAGHNEECKAAQAAQQPPPGSKPAGAAAGGAPLPAALKTRPSFAQHAPPSAGEGGPQPQLSDSFDRQPMDEDDECGICRGDPLPRSGVGVCALESPCSHRYHRVCVAKLRERLVAHVCCFCESPDFVPSWDGAVRRYAQIELRVGQGRADWQALSAEQNETVAELAAELQAAADGGDDDAKANLVAATVAAKRRELAST